MHTKHPYGKRLWWRKRLPWFLIDLGIADKGKNCESVNAEHSWYNIDNKTSGCYYCNVVVDGEKWKN
ncbi:MAG: hypothetical protein ABJK28_04015 [Algibacter sp.]